MFISNIYISKTWYTIDIKYTAIQPANQVRACYAACQGEAALGGAGRQVEGGGAGVSLHGDTTNTSPDQPQCLRELHIYRQMLISSKM